MKNFIVIILNVIISIVINLFLYFCIKDNKTKGDIKNEKML